MTRPLSGNRGFLTFCVILIAPTTLMACIWDYDTLHQERSTFPGALELITGKFLRHSKKFYQWRIADRLKRLQTQPDDPDLLDDLGVAYEKTGQHAKAVETMLAKEKAHPGRYETYSNLGTFHILAGDFDQGLPLIDKALAINPDAHFGRERYQKWLVEYAQTRRGSDGQIRFPLSRPYSDNFHKFVEDKLGRQMNAEDTESAAKGVLGMMRFANYDNPLLLEALGDLLNEDLQTTPKQLVARCYLKASYAFDDDTRAEYRELAQAALTFQEGESLESVEEAFKYELTDAQKWFAELSELESKWIDGGLDADREFDALYATDPLVATTMTETRRETRDERIGRLVMFAGTTCGGIFLAMVGGGWWLWRRSKLTNLAQQSTMAN